MKPRICCFCMIKLLRCSFSRSFSLCVCVSRNVQRIFNAGNFKVPKKSYCRPHTKKCISSAMNYPLTIRMNGEVMPRGHSRRGRETYIYIYISLVKDGTSFARLQAAFLRTLEALVRGTWVCSVQSPRKEQPLTGCLMHSRFRARVCARLSFSVSKTF